MNMSVAHALRNFFFTVRFTGGASSSSEIIICVIAIMKTIEDSVLRAGNIYDRFNFYKVNILGDLNKNKAPY